MQLSQVSLVALAISMVEAIGFSTYKDILQNRDNSAQIAYNSLPQRSHTLFLYIQIIAGSDHSSVIQDFKALVSNYGPHGVSIIPRVRYGNADGSVTTEPTDQGTILKDVSEWAQVFSEVTGQIDIPVIQAGFLGPWGEWHDGPFCSTRGSSDSTVNLNIKRQIVTTLQGSGRKIALRYPEDHKQLYLGDRSVTIHDDCIFDGGSNGYDGGTFPSSDREGWVDYTIQVASNNTFGGEGCDGAGTSTYDWSNYDDICSSSGIASYLDMLGMAYMNTGNPSAFQSLIDDSSRSSCVDGIQEALESHS